jgi:hypothetical protein
MKSWAYLFTVWVMILGASAAYAGSDTYRGDLDLAMGAHPGSAGVVPTYQGRFMIELTLDTAIPASGTVQAYANFGDENPETGYPEPNCLTVATFQVGSMNLQVFNEDTGLRYLRSTQPIEATVYSKAPLSSDCHPQVGADAWVELTALTNQKLPLTSLKGNPSELLIHVHAPKAVARMVVGGDGSATLQDLELANRITGLYWAYPESDSREQELTIGNFTLDR